MHTLRRPLIAFVALTLIVLLAAPAAADRPARQDEPVTLYLSGPVNFNINLDPQTAVDTSSGGYLTNLFLGLIAVDFDTNTIHPELATSWTVSDDGLVWTFTLRDDVPWVRWNAAAGEAEVLHMVTAHDAVYGIQRACDPRVAGGLQHIMTGIVAGCEQLAQRSVETVTDADYDLVQVRALDDVTLEITLTRPIGHFLSMAQMLLFFPVPREVVEEVGDTWADPDYVVTNGAFMLTEFVPDVRAIAWRNPHLPDDLQGSGNVERVILTPVDDLDQAFALYQAHQLDRAAIPPLEIGNVTSDPAYADQVRERYFPTVWYLGLSHDKPPLDNVHVRRAFAAMLDLHYFWEEVVPHIGIPIHHITPPGVFGAPPLDEVGVGFDPDYAREQLALAGYPNCDGLPPIEIATFAVERWMPFIISSAETVLGCDPQLFTVNWVTFEELVAQLDPALPPAERPHMCFIAWGADYLDAHNFVHDLLGCAAGPFNRPCGPVDDLIAQAAVETDVLTRVALYRDIEERFFGPEGVFPVIPVVIQIGYGLEQPWITVTDSGRGGWGRQLIDQEAQLAARGEN